MTSSAESITPPGSRVSEQELASYTLHQLVRLTEKHETERAAPAGKVRSGEMKGLKGPGAGRVKP